MTWSAISARPCEAQAVADDNTFALANQDLLLTATQAELDKATAENDEAASNFAAYRAASDAWDVVVKADHDKALEEAVAAAAAELQEAAAAAAELEDAAATAAAAMEEAAVAALAEKQVMEAEAAAAADATAKLEAALADAGDEAAAGIAALSEAKAAAAAADERITAVEASAATAAIAAADERAAMETSMAAAAASFNAALGNSAQHAAAMVRPDKYYPPAQLCTPHLGVRFLRSMASRDVMSHRAVQSLPVTTASPF